MNETAAGAHASSRTVRARVRSAALASALLGAAMVYVAGFAQPHVLHNATHDTRHALGLPCH